MFHKQESSNKGVEMSSEPGFWLLHKEWVTGRTCETCNDKRAVGANPKEWQWKTT